MVWEKIEEGKEEFMKKELIVVGLLLLLALTQKNIDIEDRNYALILGMDEKKSGQWKATYSFADLSKVAQTKGAESVSMSYNGMNQKEIEEQYNRKQDKELEYGHLKVIILGQEFIQDQRQYDRFLKELREKEEYSRNILVFCAEKEAASIVKLDEKITGLLSDRLKRLEEQHIPTKTVTLKTVLRGYWEGEEVQVPVLKKSGGIPEFIGYQTLPERAVKEKK